MKAALKSLAKLESDVDSWLSWWDKLLTKKNLPKLVPKLESFWEQAKQFEPEHEKARLLFGLAEQLQEHSVRPSEMFGILDDLISVAGSIHNEYIRCLLAFDLSVLLLGEGELLPSMDGVETNKYLAFRLLSLSLSNQPKLRQRLVNRIVFIRDNLDTSQLIVEASWDELLESSRAVGQWEWEQLDGEGHVLWEMTPIAIILGLVGRDFNKASSSDWSLGFFQRLLERLTALSPSPGREWALKQVMKGLATSPCKDNDTTFKWMTQVLEVSVATSADPSLIYEGMFLGFVGNRELRNASQVALRIPDTQLRDQAFARLSKTWLVEGEPEEAVLALQEIQDSSFRGQVALELSREAAVVSHPAAVCLLMEVASAIPSVAQRVLRRIVEHADFPEQGRRAILEESPRKPMSLSARRERLAELTFLKEHLVEEVFQNRRRELLGLASPSLDRATEDSSRIVVDCPHAYGEGHYKTPREHVQHNHFGANVGGSLVLEWDSFDAMWRDIQAEVHLRLPPEGGVHVVSLEFPIDIGVTGLIPLEKAPADQLGLEMRNGHPSLFCKDSNARQPTCQLTVVVGPSSVAPDELADYPGHSYECTLYTVYPGEAAPPFPHWEESQLMRLQIASEKALKLLEQGKVDDAKTILYQTYKAVSNSEPASLFWSSHILVR